MPSLRLGVVKQCEERLDCLRAGCRVIAEEAPALFVGEAAFQQPLLGDGRADLEGTAHALGTGTAQPTGVVTALGGGASEISSITTDVFAIDDVYALFDSLPARYRSRATWVANPLIYSLVRQFDTTGGHALWAQLGAATPERLLGRPAVDSSYMDGVIDALATNRVLLFGDMSNYVIADRIGLTVEFIPHLFATGANRPSGQRGVFAFFRSGADSVNDGGLAILDVT